LRRGGEEDRVLLITHLQPHTSFLTLSLFLNKPLGDGKPRLITSSCSSPPACVPCPVANRNFSIHKQEGGWDSVALEVIEDATKEGRGADVGAVVLGEGEFECRVLAV
jgi:hypothetical protein